MNKPKNQGNIPYRAWKIYRQDHENFRWDWISKTKPSLRALDVGCAYCYMTSAIPSTSIVAVDPSSEYLEIARDFMEINNLTHIELRQGSATELPFCDSAFDVVYCTEVLEHIEDVDAAVAELFRVSKEMIYVSVPAHGAMTQTVGHIHDFGISDLKELFGTDINWVVREPFTLLEITIG